MIISKTHMHSRRNGTKKPHSCYSNNEINLALVNFIYMSTTNHSNTQFKTQQPRCQQKCLLWKQAKEQHVLIQAHWNPFALYILHLHLWNPTKLCARSILQLIKRQNTIIFQCRDTWHLNAGHIYLTALLFHQYRCLERLLQITSRCLESSLWPFERMQNNAGGFLTPLHSKNLICISTPHRDSWAAFVPPLNIRWIFNCIVPVNSEISPARCLWINIAPI